jgi:hypothetical protein
MVKYFIPLIFVVVSCSEKPSESGVTMDDLSSSTDKYDNIDSVEVKTKIESEKPKESFFLTAFDSLYKQAEWKKMDTFLFPERFGPTFSEKWILKLPQDSLLAFNYFFSDSLKTRNAFFNWLDCFGQKCDSYAVGAMFKKQKRSFAMLVNNNQIIYLESWKKQHIHALIELFDTKKKDQNWKYVIEVPSFQKTIWYSIVSGEKIEISRP